MTESVGERRDPVGILTAALRRDRLGHGILLHGPTAATLEKVALDLASEILAADGPVLRHPDCAVVRPANKMRQIGIEAMRSLVRIISHSASRGARKVGIVFEADRLNLSAANAFLKTLEEPPPDTYLLLLSSRPNDLLDTIRSRCLAFKVPGRDAPVDDPEWAGWRGDFAVWLERIERPPGDKRDVAETVLRLYGLVQRFQQVLEAVAKSRVEAVSADLPEELPEEQRVAIEAGAERGARQDLLTGIESALRDWVVGRLGDSGDTPERVRKLALAVAETESTAGLLALNFNGVAAVEQLLIKILRIWSRR